MSSVVSSGIGLVIPEIMGALWLRSSVDLAFIACLMKKSDFL